MLMANMLDLAGEDELPAMSASRRRNLVLDTVADALLAMSRERPLLLLFEDTHWIDPTSLDLVARLLRAGPREALLLVMTTRPEGAPDLPEAELSERLVLQPLPPETAERLVRERAGAAAIDDATVTTIVARTDGVPLYVEETTAAVLDGVGGGDAVPATLRESLTARLDRLGPARETAQIAAAIGRDVDLDLLAVVSSGISVSADADRLVEAGLASPRRGGFVFSHALVQDAAYQSMLRSRRRDLHGRIAEAMLGRFRRRFASEPETLAHHLERAGRTAAAIDYFLRAADAAGARAANREAEGYAQRALALTDLLDGGAERDRREVAALLALGRIRTAIFGYGRNEAAEPLRGGDAPHGISPGRRPHCAGGRLRGRRQGAPDVPSRGRSRCGLGRSGSQGDGRLCSRRHALLAG
jgi:predicted ATPase